MEELETALWHAYGWHVSAAGKMHGIGVVASALNSREVARAQVATLLLRLPDPLEPSDAPISLAKQLHANGWFVRDWDPTKHPRTGTPPNPGWFARTDGGDPAKPETPRGAEPASYNEANPIIPIADHSEDDQVAVLTTNFKYACRVLRLDPYIASDILHELKEAAKLRPSDNCTFDTSTGDVYFNGDYIGNLKE